MVSTSPLRTVTLWPMPCDTSVSAAVAPAFAAASRIAAATRSSVAVATGKRSSAAGGGAGLGWESAGPKAGRAVIDAISAGDVGGLPHPRAKWAVGGVGYHNKRLRIARE